MKRRKPKSRDYSVVLCAGSAAAVAASGLYIALHGEAAVYQSYNQVSKHDSQKIVAPKVSIARDTAKTNKHLDTKKAITQPIQVTQLFAQMLQSEWDTIARWPENHLNTIKIYASSAVQCTQNLMFSASDRTAAMGALVRVAIAQSLMPPLNILKNIRSMVNMVPDFSRIPTTRFVADINSMLQRMFVDKTSFCLVFNYTQGVDFIIFAIQLFAAIMSGLNYETIKAAARVDELTLKLCYALLIPISTSIFRRPIFSYQNICSCIIRGFLVVAVSHRCMPPPLMPMCGKIPDDFLRDHHQICAVDGFDTANHAIADLLAHRTSALALSTPLGKQETMEHVVSAVLASAPPATTALLSDVVHVNPLTRIVSVDPSFYQSILHEIAKKNAPAAISDKRLDETREHRDSMSAPRLDETREQRIARYMTNSISGGSLAIIMTTVLGSLLP